MGVSKDCPLVLRDRMTFLVLEVLAGLKIADMPQILPFFQNAYNRRGTQPYTSLKVLFLFTPSPYLAKCAEGIRTFSSFSLIVTDKCAGNIRQQPVYPALPSYGLFPGGFRGAFLLKPYILKVGLSDFPSHLGTPFLEIPSQYEIEIDFGIFPVAGILLLSLRYYFYSCLLLSYLMSFLPFRDNSVARSP